MLCLKKSDKDGGYCEPLPLRKTKRPPVRPDGIDLKALWWSELTVNILDPEIPFDRSLQVAWARLQARLPALRAVFHPFEYQPMERAIPAGVKSPSFNAAVIGIQCGMFGRNQMGFLFPKDQIRLLPEQTTRIPLPDFLVAYSRSFRGNFSERVGEQRVCFSGSLRYIAPPSKIDPRAFLVRHRLPEDATFLLLAPTALREEAGPLLDAAIGLLTRNPRLFVLAKFHYHLPLDAEFSRKAHDAGLDGRFRLFDSDLQALFHLCLTRELGEQRRPQGHLQRRVRFGQNTRNHPFRHGSEHRQSAAERQG